MMLPKFEESQLDQHLKEIINCKWKKTVLENGKTNCIVLCVATVDTLKTNENKNKKVVARFYGKNTSTFINRERELENIQFLSEYGLAPKILKIFNNGYILEYKEGKVLNLDQMAKYKKLIAEEMRKYHSLKQNGPSNLFKTLNDWYWKAYVNHKDFLLKNNILKMIKQAEEQTKNCKTGFCHNDLLSSNMILSFNENNTLSDIINISRNNVDNLDNLDNSVSPNNLSPNKVGSNKVGSNNSYSVSPNNLNPNNTYSVSPNKVGSNIQTEKLTFIDFEYSGINFISYDLANHFREYIGYSFDIKKFPNESDIIEFLQYYYGSNINDKIIKHTIKEIRYFLPLVDIFWGLWALLKSDQVEKSEDCSEKNDTIRSTDFDYMKYAKFKIGLVPEDFSDWWIE
ncbi:serine/threonine protein kinase [Pseudoloma neurophilia]|uniref:Serine/threonine protein kinase n=1 Tax=Pseudoloma neurophilia TaxID=146866 RepID=A0A0R0LZW6_9MICR|nr:serine/threonine protein kinase [Pseudoloma neurophilia]